MVPVNHSNISLYTVLKLRHLLSPLGSLAREYATYAMLRTGLWLKRIKFSGKLPIYELLGSSSIYGFQFKHGYVVKKIMQFQSPRGNPLGGSSF